MGKHITNDIADQSVSGALSAQRVSVGGTGSQNWGHDLVVRDSMIISNPANGDNENRQYIEMNVYSGSSGVDWFFLGDNTYGFYGYSSPNKCEFWLGTDERGDMASVGVYSGSDYFKIKSTRGILLESNPSYGVEVTGGLSVSGALTASGVSSSRIDVKTGEQARIEMTGPSGAYCWVETNDTGIDLESYAALDTNDIYMWGAVDHVYMRQSGSKLFFDGGHGVSASFNGPVNVSGALTASSVIVSGSAGYTHIGTPDSVTSYVIGQTGLLRFVDAIPSPSGNAAQIGLNAGNATVSVTHDTSTHTTITSQAGLNSVSLVSSGTSGSNSLSLICNSAQNIVTSNKQLKIQSSASGSDFVGNVNVSGTFAASGSYFRGDVEVSGSPNGLILSSPDGTRWRLTIDNSGTLTAASL